jgi:hypothetical protein
MMCKEHWVCFCLFFRGTFSLLVVVICDEPWWSLEAKTAEACFILLIWICLNRASSVDFVWYDSLAILTSAHAILVGLSWYRATVTSLCLPLLLLHPVHGVGWFSSTPPHLLVTRFLRRLSTIRARLDAACSKDAIQAGFSRGTGLGFWEHVAYLHEQAYADGEWTPAGVAWLAVQSTYILSIL